MKKYLVRIEKPTSEEFFIIQKDIYEQYNSEILPKDFSEIIFNYEFMIEDESLERIEEILEEFSGKWCFEILS